MHTTRQWQFAWKFSFRATGWLLAFIGVAALIARLLIAVARWDAAQAAFGSFMLIIPLIAGLHASLLFAPDDEPALELLLSAPRPTLYLIYERLAALGILQGGLALALTTVTALTSSEVNALDMIVVWLPPAVCMIGLCLLATLYARKMSFGMLMAIGISVAMAVGRDVILPMFPNLWFIMFYLDPRGVTPEQYAFNRLLMIAVGIAAFALVLYRMRDEERLLGIGEARNG